MNRAEIMKKADEVIHGIREQVYGDPEDNFTCISRLWSVYLGVPINAADVAAMMILLKVARIGSGQTLIDNWIDIAGYAACGGEIQTGKEEE